MSFEYINRTYGLSAAMHGRVEYTGGAKPHKGTIVGTDNAHLCIKLDGEKKAKRFHPTWEMRHLADEGHAGAETPQPQNPMTGGAA